MWLKKLGRKLLICTVVVGCLMVPVGAVEDDSILLTDAMQEVVDVLEIMHLGNVSVARVTGSVNFNVAANTLAAASESVYLDAGETVTINCSYFPSSASVDFGLISSGGIFYSLNVTGGSINKTIRISEYDKYTFAVRNNSFNTVSVTGFVTY